MRLTGRTDDFIITPDGSGVIVLDARGDALQNRIRLSLAIHKGSFIADETFGSELHTIRKATDGNATLAARFAEAALRHMVMDGSIKRVNASASVDSLRGGIDIALDIQLPTGEPLIFNHWVSI